MRWLHRIAKRLESHPLTKDLGEELTRRLALFQQRTSQIARPCKQCGQLFFRHRRPGRPDEFCSPDHRKVFSQTYFKTRDRRRHAAHP